MGNPGNLSIKENTKNHLLAPGVAVHAHDLVLGRIDMILRVRGQPGCYSENLRHKTQTKANEMTQWVKTLAVSA